MPRLRLSSRREAEAYFDRWVRRGDRTLEAFAKRMAAAGGPVEALTFEPDSLPQVFGWVAARTRYVHGEVADDGDLPPWYLPGPITRDIGDFDAESARWADGLSRYWGEVLVRHLPGVRWAVADEPRRRKQFVDQWWPVVLGPLLSVNPLNAGALAAKQGRLPEQQRDDAVLLTHYRTDLEIVTRSGGDLLGADGVGDGWWVDDVDVDAVRSLGWRYEVGGPEDAVGEEVDALSALLGLAPGVARVERQDRVSWLVAGEVDRAVLEGVLRGWVRSR